jgi:hypothetical protein
VSATPNGVGEICVSIDSLLDTVLGTLSKLAGPDAALAALKAGYLDQSADLFPDIMEDADFRQGYAERDVKTLQHSVPTRWLFDLGGLMSSLFEQSLVRPYYSEFVLTINLFPYQLSNAEQVAIRRAVQYWTGPQTRVSLAHLSPEDLTPQYVKTHFACLVDRDPYTWLNVQAKAFESARCPDVTFIAPAIYHQAPPSKETLATLDPKVGSPFASMLFLTKPLVDLALVKPRLFRMVDPKTKPEKASTSERTTVERNAETGQAASDTPSV